MGPTSNNSYPISPEEEMNAFAALALLHEFYATGKKDEEHRLSILQGNVILEKLPYLQLHFHNEENDPMPCDYFQMVLHPKAGNITGRDFSEIVVNFPHLDETEQPFDLPEEVEEWNDVSLQITFAGGVQGRYWLNRKGLIAYKDADDLALDYERGWDTADLFTVQVGKEDVDAPRLTSTMLLAWVRQSVAKPLTNNPDEE